MKLATAATFGFIDQVQELLNKGTDPNEGNAILHAAARGHDEIVEMLLAAGADPDKGAALEYAARYNHTHIFEIILNVSIDPDKINRALLPAAAGGRVQDVEMLLNKGADPNEVEALKEAAYYGHIQVVELLLSVGADPDKGEALQHAAFGNNIKIVEMLLSAGANLNRGEALYWPAEKGYDEIVEMLLTAGADIRFLSRDKQEEFKHLAPIYISIQEYLMLEPFIINILELKDRFIVDIFSGEKYVILKFLRSNIYVEIQKLFKRILTSIPFLN